MPDGVYARLGLGTAQFGMKYGVTNATGQVSPIEARRILMLAHEYGIRVLDTASAYGESEALLGELVDESAGFKVVTKASFSHKGAPYPTSESVTESFFCSLKRMRRSSVYGLLVHCAADVCRSGGDRILDVFQSLKERGLVEKVGVSIYTHKEVEDVLRIFTPDIIQVPLNVLDARFTTTGLLDELAARGVEIHARSVFLQGVLLSDPESLPSYFERYKGMLSRFREKVAGMGLSPLEAALGYALSLNSVHTVLVGVASCVQLREIMDAADADVCTDAFSDCQSLDNDLLNPSHWVLGESV